MTSPTADRTQPDAGDRLRGLLDAHRTIASDLSLASMLHRIVQEACELVGARYGALGVRGPDGMLEQFFHHGMDEETVERIGMMPKGVGLLAAMVDDPKPVRLADLGADPRSVGFPLHHPPMHALLGVPIMVRGAAFGSLYLTEPVAGGEFDADDENLATALAGLAGTAIANARHYEEAQRSNDWLNASGDIARALLADADVDMLMQVVSSALHVAEADYGGLILPTSDGLLKVSVTVGLGADFFRSLVFDPTESPLGRAILAGESLHVDDLRLMAKDDFDNVYDFGPTMMAPLVDAKGVRGAVVLMRTVNRAQFDDQDMERATTFAAQVALALQLNDARADAEWMRVLEDRQRIGNDLHDNVMQRLFATGVGLQSLVHDDLPAATADKLSRYIAELDETIDEIRERVFGLRNSQMLTHRPPRRFPRVADNEAVPTLGADRRSTST